jgi:hypothetical protein
MPKKEYVFRTRWENLEGAILWVVVASGGLILSMSLAAKVWIIISAVLFVHGVFNLAHSFYAKVKITSTEIIVLRNFRTQSIAWSEISVLEPKRNGFLLSNSDNTIRVFISGQIVNLWRFVKFVSHKRQDLLQSNKIVFHENPFVTILLGIAGLFIIYLSITQLILKPINLAQALIVLILGLAFVFVAISFSKRISFDGDNITVKTLLKTQIIYPDGIDFSANTNSSMFIISKDKFSVSVENLVEGIPSFYLAFWHWLHSHQTVQ